MEFIHKQKRRWYRVEVTTDLFGCTVVVRDFGSLDSNRGRRITDIAEDQADAVRKMGDVVKRRVSRGYCQT